MAALARLPALPEHRAEDIRTGNTPESIKRAFLENLYCQCARFPAIATRNDLYMALAFTVRDRLLHRWICTAEHYLNQQSRTACYFSAEYLIGPQLGKNILNLRVPDPVP